MDFEVEARPDADTYYIATGRADRTQRLKAISTWTETAADGTGGSRATRLVLGYGVSATSGRSLVTSLTWYGAWDGEVLPPTTFNYGQKDPNATPRFVQRGTANAAGPVLEDASAANQAVCATISHPAGSCGHKVGEMFVTGDFNGDGVPDLMTKFADVGSIKLYLTDPAGVFSYGGDAPFGLSLDSSYIVVGVGDFDGDGQSDVLLASKVIGKVHGGSGGTGINGDTYKNWKICFSRLRTTGAFSCQDWAEAGQLDAQGYSQSDLFKVYDFDGDGRDDVYLSGSFKLLKELDNAGTQRLCMSTGTGFTCQTVGNQIVNLSNGLSSDGFGHDQQPRIGRAFTDIDGDGHVDLVQFLLPYRNCGSTDVPCKNTDYYQYDGVGAQVSSYNTAKAQQDFFGFGITPSTPGYQQSTTSMFGDVVAGDLNGDGYSDLFVWYVPSTGSSPYYQRCLGMGSVTATCTPVSWPAGTVRARYVSDVDGDGVNHLFMAWNGAPFTSCYLLGGTVTCPTTWTQAVSPAAGSTGDLSIDSETAHDDWMDLSGNGTLDRVLYDVGGKWTIQSPVSLAKTGEALDRLVQITDGLGKKTQFVYALPGDASVYQPDAVDKDGVAIPVSYPLRRVPRMGALVKTMKVDNGQGGWVERDYAYSGATRDLTGRGFLGFARVDVTDVRVASPRSGTTASQWFATAWPHIGSPVASRTRSASGATLSLSTRTLASTTNVLGSAPETTACAYASSRSDQRWDLSGDAFGATTTTVTGVDAFCNVTDSQVTTTWGSGGTHTSTTHVDFTNDTTRWCLGLPTTTKVTNLRDGATVVRTTGATYASDSTCAAATQVVEPNDATNLLKLTTVLDRSISDTDATPNKFGLVRKTTQQWTSPVDGSAKSRTVKQVMTRDAQSRFEQQVKNAAGHLATTVYDSRNGTVTSVTDPNGLVSTRITDAFGLSVTDVDAESNEHRKYSVACDVTCPANAKRQVVEDSLNKSGTTYTRITAPTIHYLDDAGRELRTATWGFDGRVIDTDQGYDARGRHVTSTHPYFAGDTSITATTLVYDDLDRVTTTRTYDESNKPVNTIMTYAGASVTTQNALTRTKVETHDGLGLLVQAQDANAKLTTYGRDPFGNLAAVTDAVGNVVSIGYDTLGRRTSLNDPDLGLIKEWVDPLGRTWKSESPNQRKAGTVTTTDYDDLDRRTHRLEPDLESRWIYDTAAHGLGLLGEVRTEAAGATTFNRVYTYDTLSRVTSVRAGPDPLNAYYTSTTGYDGYGRANVQTHQRDSGPTKTFTTAFNGMGFAQTLTNGANKVLWSASTLDAADRELAASYGNGTAIARVYDPHTGRLTSARTATSDASNIERYLETNTYDVLGNVLTRTNRWDTGQADARTAGDTFTYDTMNRLWTQSTNGSKYTMSYDDIGNITSKGNFVSGGLYTYPGAGQKGPHAVSSVAGVTGTYTYDDDGNMLNSPYRGTTLTWTSFDMPVKISSTGTSGSDTFVYGPDHERLRKTIGSGTKTIYMGAIEASIDSSNKVTVKTYWPSGLGLDIDAPDGTTSLYWMLKDRLGDVRGQLDVNGNFPQLTDWSGTHAEMLDYDAWGYRRNATGSGHPGNTILHVDTKGYTGHELLDNVELVHMNGRVYDPNLGRFLSADPVVQAPENSQSYNRYTYVWNNPTNVTESALKNRCDPHEC